MPDSLDKKFVEATLQDINELYGKYHLPLSKDEPLPTKVTNFLGCNRDNLYLEERRFPAFQIVDINDALSAFFEKQKIPFDMKGLDFDWGERGLDRLFISAREAPLVLERTKISITEERGAASNAIVFPGIKEEADRFVVTVTSSKQMFDNGSLIVGYIRRRDQKAAVHAGQFFNDIAGWIRSNSSFKGQAIRPIRSSYGRIASYDFIDFPKIKREQIILDQIIWDLLERNLFSFYENREAFKKSKISLKRGILLTGDPGTGKTMLCQLIANSFNGYTTIYVPTATIEDIADIINMAKSLQPAVLIIEDVDLAAEDRKHSKAKAILGELMNQMEGFSANDDIVFLCTTNHLEAIEPAIIARPGRIDQIIELPRPNDELRHKLIRLYTEGVDINVRVDHWVQKTRGYTPAAIKELIKKAGSRAVLEKRQKEGRIALSDKDLQIAFDDLASQMNKVKETVKNKKTASKSK